MKKSKIIVLSLVTLSIMTGLIAGYWWGVKMLAIVSISTFLMIVTILAKMDKINYKA